MITPTSFDGSSIFAPPPTASNQSDLGQEDFLTLMITQFRNQDPFEPMDNGEFLGQLAQFSTVNGIESLNGEFAGLAGALRDEQALQAANLVGHTVLATTDSTFFDGTEAVGGAIDLDAAASNVEVDIVNANGELVQRLTLGEQAPGTVNFDWDGRDLDGEIANSGNYQVNARVIRGTNIESTTTFLRAEVESVTLGQFGRGMTLNLSGGNALSLAQIHQII
ncbi:MAG TPA: flagellar hook assembly protein FlgD [Woeseiaceae bacterium]|nr:flagellar hook assembly protein FlgD [Woeseiaceae bacterium]